MGIKKRVRKFILRHVTSPREIQRYIRTNKLRKLHIAAGDNLLNGWLNTDLIAKKKGVYALDASKILPIHGDVFDYIYSEHFIEHLNYQQAGLFLLECFRILKPGGKIRIASPNLNSVINLQTDKPSAEQKNYIDWINRLFLKNFGADDINNPVFVINSIFYGHGHKFIYDIKTLSDIMNQAGFNNIIECRYGESSDPNLKNLEMHGSAIKNLQAAVYETLIIEGQTPNRPL